MRPAIKVYSGGAKDKISIYIVGFKGTIKKYFKNGSGSC
jgi:hypothetical protein